MKLVGSLDMPKGENMPIVIISHGFLSFKENKLLYNIGQACFEKGFAALRFDFSGCVGESEGGCDDILVSHHVDDLISVINQVQEFEDIDSDKVFLVGHSLGGFVSTIVASQDKRVKALVSIAAPANLEMQSLLTKKIANKWKHDHKKKFSTETRGDIEISFNFYEDFKEYDLLKVADKVRCPVRLIHGDRDKIVGLKSSRAIFEKLKSEKNLEVIKDGDHMLFKQIPEVSSLVVDWFSKF